MSDAPNFLASNTNGPFYGVTLRLTQCRYSTAWFRHELYNIHYSPVEELVRRSRGYYHHCLSPVLSCLR